MIAHDDALQRLRAAERGIDNLDTLGTHGAQHEALALALGCVIRAVEACLIAPGWVHLPRRDTALNLARVSRVEFHRGNCANIYFDHAECEDDAAPTVASTAQLAIVAEDTAAIRRALGLPDEAA